MIHPFSNRIFLYKYSFSFGYKFSNSREFPRTAIVFLLFPRSAPSWENWSIPIASPLQ